MRNVDKQPHLDQNRIASDQQMYIQKMQYLQRQPMKGWYGLGPVFTQPFGPQELLRVPEEPRLPKLTLLELMAPAGAPVPQETKTEIVSDGQKGSPEKSRKDKIWEALKQAAR